MWNNALRPNVGLQWVCVLEHSEPTTLTARRRASGLQAVQSRGFWNITPRECTVKYCPSRKRNTKNQLLRYYLTFEDKTEINLNYLQQQKNILSILLDSGYTFKYSPLPSGVPSAERLYFTVYHLSRPNTNTLQKYNIMWQVSWDKILAPSL